MDDFNIDTLRQCTNELCSRLVNILTPLVCDGFRSIFDEAWKLCLETKETSKYLMTFQNLLCRIPKWNPDIINAETKRIVEQSGCNYLEDIITCVHIVQLKTLTAIRVANKLKKIDITIPKQPQFIHKVYILAARKLYCNVYLFERPHFAAAAAANDGDATAAAAAAAAYRTNSVLQQKNNRDIEIIVQDSILNAVRESIPIEEILRAYMDETVHEHEEIIEVTTGTAATAPAAAQLTPVVAPLSDVTGSAITTTPIAGSSDLLEITTLPTTETVAVSTAAAATTAAATPAPAPVSLDQPLVIDTVPLGANDDPLKPAGLSFNDIDMVLNKNNQFSFVPASKDPEHLEKIAQINHERRKIEDALENDNSGGGKLKILDDAGSSSGGGAGGAPIVLATPIDLAPIQLSAPSAPAPAPAAPASDNLDDILGIEVL